MSWEKISGWASLVVPAVLVGGFVIWLGHPVWGCVAGAFSGVVGLICWFFYQLCTHGRAQ